MRLKWLKLKRRWLEWKLSRLRVRMSKCMWLIGNQDLPKLCTCRSTIVMNLRLGDKIIHYCPFCLGDLAHRTQPRETSTGVD